MEIVLWRFIDFEKEEVFILTSSSSHKRNEIRKSCWCRRNPTSNVKGNKQPESTLLKDSLWGGVGTWKNTKRRVDRYDHFHMQERRLKRVYELSRNITSWPSRKVACHGFWMEMPRNNEIKVGRWPVWFSSKSLHHGPNFHSEANLWKILGLCKGCLCMFCWSRKGVWPDFLDTLWRVLQDYGINGYC